MTQPRRSTSMTITTRSGKRRPRASAARQALQLCETTHPGPGPLPRQRVTTITPRAALRAAGLPPLLAASLRSRLRLIAETDGEQ